MIEREEEKKEVESNGQSLLKVCLICATPPAFNSADHNRHGSGDPDDLWNPGKTRTPCPEQQKYECTHCGEAQHNALSEQSPFHTPSMPASAKNMVTTTRIH
jgi:hypothetical protein